MKHYLFALSILILLAMPEIMTAAEKVPVFVWTPCKDRINKITVDPTSHNILLTQDVATELINKNGVYHANIIPLQRLNYGKAISTSGYYLGYIGKYGNPLKPSEPDTFFLNMLFYNLKNGKNRSFQTLLKNNNSSVTVLAKALNSTSALFRLNDTNTCYAYNADLDTLYSFDNLKIDRLSYYELNGHLNALITSTNEKGRLLYNVDCATGKIVQVPILMRGSYTYNPTNIVFNKLYVSNDEKYLVIYDYHAFLDNTPSGDLTLYSLNLDSMSITRSYTFHKHWENGQTDGSVPADSFSNRDTCIFFNGYGGWNYITGDWNNKYIHSPEPTPIPFNYPGVVDVINGDTTLLVMSDSNRTLGRVNWKDGAVVGDTSIIYSEYDKDFNRDARIYRYGQNYILLYQSSNDTAIVKSDTGDVSIDISVNKYRFYNIRTGEIVSEFFNYSPVITQNYDDYNLYGQIKHYDDDYAVFINTCPGESYMKGNYDDYHINAYLFDIKKGIVTDTFLLFNNLTDSLRLCSISDDGKIFCYNRNRNITNDTTRLFTLYFKRLDGRMIGSYKKKNTDTDMYEDKKYSGQYSSEIMKIGVDRYFVKTIYSTIFFKMIAYYYEYALVSHDSLMDLPASYKKFDKFDEAVCSPSGKYMLTLTDQYTSEYQISDLNNGCDSICSFRVFPSGRRANFVTDSTLIFSPNAFCSPNVIINISNPKSLFGYAYWIGYATPIDEDYCIGENWYIYKWTDSNLVDVKQQPEKQNSSCSFSIFPTPANNVLNVKMNSESRQYPDKITGKIINMNGETVKTIQSASPEFEINTSDLPSGAYLIIIENPHLQRSEFRMFNILK